MKCLKCVNRVKAEWRSSMKIYFHGFGGLGGARRPVDVCSARTGVERRLTPTSGKCILHVQMHCLPISNIYVARVEF